MDPLLTSCPGKPENKTSRTCEAAKAGFGHLHSHNFNSQGVPQELFRDGFMPAVALQSNSFTGCDGCASADHNGTDCDIPQFAQKERIDLNNAKSCKSQP